MTLEEFAYETEDIKAPTFIVPVKYYEIVNQLSVKEAGELFKALFQVAKDPDNANGTDGENYFYGWQKAVYDMMKSDIIADCKKYRRMVINNRRNSKKGGRPKKD